MIEQQVDRTGRLEQETVDLDPEARCETGPQDRAQREKKGASVRFLTTQRVAPL
jgi:hypothetical protein